ncbi:hypothetical protein BMF35_a0166 [Aurantiacibacter gangjinensis]|nr:hypothetical protein BMF35_a0166 [Aurantiacibacter gangjinensis]
MHAPPLGQFADFCTCHLRAATPKRQRQCSDAIARPRHRREWAVR